MQDLWGVLTGGIFMGVLLGIAATVSVYSIARNAAERRYRRQQRRMARARRVLAKEAARGSSWTTPSSSVSWGAGGPVPGQTPPPTWPKGAPVPDYRESGLKPYMEGKRKRPFNPEPGPRDW